MTPKLYDDVNRKFFCLWGNYAGWAHSVNLSPRLVLCVTDFLLIQVLFTADLKSFSSYGLPTLESAGPSIPTPPDTPVSPLKKPATAELKVAVSLISEQSGGDLSYRAGPAERVKKRRRMV